MIVLYDGRVVVGNKVVGNFAVLITNCLRESAAVFYFADRAGVLERCRVYLVALPYCTQQALGKLKIHRVIVVGSWPYIESDLHFAAEHGVTNGQ